MTKLDYYDLYVSNPKTNNIILQLGFDYKSDALREAVEFRNLGMKVEVIPLSKGLLFGSDNSEM